MAQRDRTGPGDVNGAPDLPLTSVPSIPETRSRRAAKRAAPAGSGWGGYVAGGVALFALIVVISFIAAPYVKVPPGAEPEMVAEPITAEAPAGPAAPAPERAPVVPARQQRKPEPARPAEVRTASPPQLAQLPRDLDAKENALLASQRQLDAERKARQKAERATDGKLTAQRKKLEKQHRTAAAALKKELTKEQAAAERRAAEKDTELTAARQRIANLEAGLADADKRAVGAESASRSMNARHDATLQAESDGVRRLLAQLEDVKRDLSKERDARRAAETRLRQLEQQPARTAAARPAAAPPPPTRGASGGPSPTQQPVRIKTVPPTYPDDLRRARVAGRVLLRVLVDERGDVTDIAVSETPHPRLATVAEKAARQWKYSPARRDGVRVKVWINEAVDFQL